ncbi:MAG: aminotransferase class III-fold pyridoxal phosphate-dependent enzyme, partial [Balneolaceae bacterium]|nr:aminotransferase class III-fold pyridoxal phosphate-dependent enzyme [Balneolaceae bacterium]
VIGETIRSSPFLPHPEYWNIVREACDRHGALLILDEIPHAFGRTGAMFTHQHYGIVPDLLVLGKGLGGGVVPFAAVLAKDELNEAIKERAMGHFTHEKSPLGSRAALAMIQIIEREGLVEQATKKGAFALQHLQKLKAEHSWISDVRGLGLMIGVELRHPDTSKPAKELANDVMVRCLELGLNFKISMGCIVNWTPPLTVTQDQLSRATSILNQALQDCTPS